MIAPLARASMARSERLGREERLAGRMSFGYAVSPGPELEPDGELRAARPAAPHRGPLRAEAAGLLQLLARLIEDLVLITVQVWRCSTTAGKGSASSSTDSRFLQFVQWSSRRVRRARAESTVHSRDAIQGHASFAAPAGCYSSLKDLRFGPLARPEDGEHRQMQPLAGGRGFCILDAWLRMRFGFPRARYMRWCR
jgi:hypothetical protein